MTADRLEATVVHEAGGPAPSAVKDVVVAGDVVKTFHLLANQFRSLLLQHLVEDGQRGRGLEGVRRVRPSTPEISTYGKYYET